MLVLLVHKIAFPRTIIAFEIEGIPFRVQNFPTFPKNVLLKFTRNPESPLNVAVKTICKAFNKKYDRMFESIECLPDAMVEVDFSKPHDERDTFSVEYRQLTACGEKGNIARLVLFGTSPTSHFVECLTSYSSCETSLHHYDQSEGKA
jgi:hypothetical protein